jgi:hypothetical protein
MCEQHKPGNAISTVLIDNLRTRVTEWRFKKRGDNTGWHRHEYDYIVVPYFREVGVEHDVINGNDFECVFVEIEFLK